mgnify:CR=1 FL=1
MNNQYSSSSSDSGVDGGEKDDFELPANWPDYDFHRKKSCLLNRIFSTCVTKAINHLELVQNAIEDRNQARMLKIKRKQPQQLYSILAKQQVKREVSFSQIPSSGGDALEVVGKGGHVPDNHAHPEILEDELLDEVLLLLARLDRERLRLINSCEREQLIRLRLRDNIDHWRLKRLHDLPLAVQKGSLSLSFFSIFFYQFVFRT